MFRFRKSGGTAHIRKATGSKKAVLDKLRAFLDKQEPETIEFLVNFWNSQSEGVTYKELREAYLSGDISPAQLHKWQLEYAELINTKLAPQWYASYQQGAKDAAARYKFLYEPSVQAAYGFVRQHGAELVTALAQGQKDALQAMIANAVGNTHVTADELARVMRPAIGLTVGQARANRRHYETVKSSLLEANPNADPDKVKRRAKESAAKYAARQHRYRAQNIARTELAFAYNEGHHGAVQDAISRGYIGDCKKVWLTADDERVCPICGGIDGEKRGLNELFSIGKPLPPAHPSCRCAVAYEEIEGETTPENLTTGRSSGKIGDTDGDTVIENIREIDFNDKNAVDKEIKTFLDKYSNNDIEHAIVITKSGKLYELRGTHGTVDTGIVGAEELIDSIGAHNHPVWEGYDKGDSFSFQDLKHSIEYKTGIEYLTSGTRRDAFVYTGNMTKEEAYYAYKSAKEQYLEKAYYGKGTEYEQAETMRELSKTLEGLNYYENIRRRIQGTL